MAAKRLQRELVMLAKSAPDLIRVKAAPEDILTFHYVIEGPKDSLYAGGWYHGYLKFPAEYPMKAPSVLMLTPNGRFAVNTRICLSMSDYHPESWNPVWTSDKILMGLLSFMLENEVTAGAITTSDDAKRKFATESLDFNVRSSDFRKLFPELVDMHEKKRHADGVPGL